MQENIFLHEYGAESPMTKLSDVNSYGASPIMHAGKSIMGILDNREREEKKKIRRPNELNNCYCIKRLARSPAKTYIFLDPT